MAMYWKYLGLFLAVSLGGVTPVYASDTPVAPAIPPLSVYGRLPGFEMASLSPSGDRIALIGLVGDERRLIVIDKSTKPILVQALGTIKVRSLHWAGESIVMVQKTDTAGLGMGFSAAKTELSSMIVVPLTGGKPYSVFQNNNLITGGIRGFHGTLERAGKWYGYFGGMTMDGTRDNAILTSTDPVLYEVDLETGRARKIAGRSPAQEDRRNWLIGGDGAVKATIDYQSRNGRWTIRNSAGAKIAEGVEPLGGIDLIGFGARSDTLIYSAEDESQDRAPRWFEVPLAGGPATEVLADAAIKSSFFDNRTHAFLGYEVEGDTPTYRFFDHRQQKIVDATLKAFPHLSTHILDWNDSFDRLIVMTEGPDDPQSWWSVDIKTGEAQILGTSYAVPPAAVGPMKMVSYTVADGKNISAVLTLPPGRKAENLPVVILPHGGPAERDYPGFDWGAQAFASKGYAVLQPNFRGSTGYGAAFQHAGDGEWGRKMQTDISDGLGYLAKQGIVDPKRACIVGASYGGYAALAGVTLQKGFYRCAVAVAGVSDVAKMAATDVYESGGNGTVTRSLKVELGRGKDLRAVSPVNFAAQADAPILLIHGKDDVVVLYDQSNDMASALRRAGKPVEFVTLKGEDHWLSRSETRLTMLAAAVAFVEKHNPSDKGP